MPRRPNTEHESLQTHTDGDLDYAPLASWGVWYVRAVLLVGIALALVPGGLGLGVLWCMAVPLLVVLRTAQRIRIRGERVELELPLEKWVGSAGQIRWVRGWIHSPVRAWTEGVVIIRTAGPLWRLPYYVLHAPYLAWLPANEPRNKEFVEVAQWLRDRTAPPSAASSDLPTVDSAPPLPVSPAPGGCVYECEPRRIRQRVAIAVVGGLGLLGLLATTLLVVWQWQDQVIASMFILVGLGLLLRGTLGLPTRIEVGDELRVRSSYLERLIPWHSIVRVERYHSGWLSWRGQADGAAMRIWYTDHRGKRRSEMIPAGFDTEGLLADLRQRLPAGTVHVAS